LIDGLRPLASKEDLSPFELLREFVSYDFDIDESLTESCVCGKQGLKLVYLHPELSV
jgi:hypothetical protein